MVFLFLADGFEEIEALTPVDLLRRGGVEVVTVGVSGKTVTGSHGITVSADVGAEEALAMLAAGTIPEMIVLPGGMPGAATLDASPLVDTFIDAAEKADSRNIWRGPPIWMSIRLRTAGILPDVLWAPPPNLHWLS